LKDRLIVVLNDLMEPMRERRAKYESKPGLVLDARDHGSTRARVIARETMERVRDALELNYLQRADSAGLTQRE
jgi:tryptophanyl-tRNA synthetase